MQQIYEIRKNIERYEGLGVEMPDQIICFGTIEQAREMAFRLSNWYAGCDYIFYVHNDPDDY